MRTLLPTFQRFLRLCASRESLPRFLTNETLVTLKIGGGLVLDIGGEPNSPKNCRRFFHDYDTWLSLNIDPSKRPDIVGDCNWSLPFKDAVFDAVLAISALEHIRNIDLAVREIVRIAKPGGMIVLQTPFLFELHGAPDDFHRPTESWWRYKLLDLGIPSEELRVQALYWDAFSSAYSLLDNFWSVRKRRLMRPFFLLPGLLSAIAGKKPTYDAMLPVSYMIIAKKASA